MKENTLRAKLQRGEVAYGMLTPIYDPAIVEVIGRLGFDFYMMDGEHGAGGPLQLEHLVRACETVGMTPLVRVPTSEPKAVLQYLDTGVMGVMLPGVREAGDVQRLVDAVKYPPVGQRGVAGVRANDYLLGPMAQADYVRFANEQTLILPQIETMEAVDNIEALVRVQGIDGFIVGPRDLSMAMGFYDGPAHPEVRAVIDHVFEVVLGAGLLIGTTAPTGEEAADLVARGARIILGSVAWLLQAGAGRFFQAARQAPS